MFKDIYDCDHNHLTEYFLQLLLLIKTNIFKGGDSHEERVAQTHPQEGKRWLRVQRLLYGQSISIFLLSRMSKRGACGLVKLKEVCCVFK
jgi:hypothetical protein